MELPDSGHSFMMAPNARTTAFKKLCLARAWPIWGGKGTSVPPHTEKRRSTRSKAPHSGSGSPVPLSSLFRRRCKAAILSDILDCPLLRRSVAQADIVGLLARMYCAQLWRLAPIFKFQMPVPDHVAGSWTSSCLAGNDIYPDAFSLRAPELNGLAADGIDPGWVELLEIACLGIAERFDAAGE